MTKWQTYQHHRRRNPHQHIQHCNQQDHRKSTQRNLSNPRKSTMRALSVPDQHTGAPFAVVIAGHGSTVEIGWGI